MDKLPRLMSPDLPQTIEPLRLAKAGKKISGQFLLQDMPRLGELLYENSGYVAFNLSFSKDEKCDIYYISGDIVATLKLVCQRCLDNMEFSITNPIKLGLLSRQGDIYKLPESHEPLVLGEEPIPLLEMIEDELLLAVPIAPVHKAEACKATETLSAMHNISEYKPFAALNVIKHKMRS